ncbi:MAG: SURF1 family protein [Porticoccaceae bacterium]
MPSDPQRHRKPRFQWRLNGKLLLFCLPLLPVTLGLGFWQLQRADQKRELIATYDSRRQAVPIPMAAVTPGSDHLYVRVQVAGVPDTEHQFLLDNRMRGSHPGFEVLTPVALDSGGWVLVNRGWLAAGATRAQLPDIPPLPARVDWVGYLYRVPGKPLVLGREEPAGWPQVIEQTDQAQLERRLGHALFPDVVRLESSPGLDTAWTMVNLTPEQHLGYAVQWFALAAALAILTFVSNSNIAERVQRTGAPERE